MYPFGKGMTTTDSPVKFLLAKATVMVPLSIVQALILYFSLKGFCGFTPARPGLCLAFMLLLSLAFMAFIAFLAIAFGRIGEFIALIFMVFNLVLQLVLIHLKLHHIGIQYYIHSFHSHIVLMDLDQ